MRYTGGQRRKRIAHLHATISQFGATTVTVEHADASKWLSGTPRPFDVVFLDPPFRQNWIARCLPQLAAPGWLATGALIYIEIEAGADLPQLPVGWHIHRDKKAGNVRYMLIKTSNG
ncbi:MAG: RsmD family RNA methyltransferase [Gammaproteobacteria bacterium]